MTLNKLLYFVTCLLALVLFVILLDASSCGIIIGVEVQCPSSPKTMTPNHTMVSATLTFSSLHFTLILNFPTAIPQGSIIEQFVHDNFVVRLHVLMFLLLE